MTPSIYLSIIFALKSSPHLSCQYFNNKLLPRVCLCNHVLRGLTLHGGVMAQSTRGQPSLNRLVFRHMETTELVKLYSLHSSFHASIPAPISFVRVRSRFREVAIFHPDPGGVTGKEIVPRTSCPLQHSELAVIIFA